MKGVQCFCKYLTISLLLLVMACSKQNTGEWSVTSPDHRLKMTIYLDSSKLYYTVKMYTDTDTDSVEVVSKSALGISFANIQFNNNLYVKLVQPVSKISNTTYNFKGKQSNIINNANELEITFANKNNSELKIKVRAYNEGVAFKYYLVSDSGQNNYVTHENTEFNIPNLERCWLRTYNNAQTIKQASHAYINSKINDSLKYINSKLALPALFNSGKNWIFLSETGYNSNNYVSFLQAHKNGFLTIAPDTLTQNINGKNKTSGLPTVNCSAWRIIILNPDLAYVVESNMVSNLNEIGNFDLSWIKPGRILLDYNTDSTVLFFKLMQSIRLANKMGFEYLLPQTINSLNTDSVKKLVSYALTQHVNFIMPYNFENINEVKILNDSVLRNNEFVKLAKMGIKGLNINFVNNCPIQLMHTILHETAQHQLILSFEGTNLPITWWQNGANLLNTHNNRLYNYNATIENTISPFTENIMGSNTGLPIALLNTQKTLATAAHQLAQSIIFESSLKYFAITDSVYNLQPNYVKEFLKGLPVVWTETRFIVGEPGRDIIMARRAGNNWYVAGLNGENADKEATFALFFITEGEYNLKLIWDGNKPNTYKLEEKIYKPGNEITITMKGNGGFVAWLEKIDY